MLSLPWTNETIHFLDFEGNATSGILEYGLVTLRRGKIVEVSTRLCQPHGQIRPEDIALHGITADRAAPFPPIEEDWETFAQARESGPLAAHFASTENSLLKSVWPYPRQAPDFFGLGEMISEWGPWIDTGRLIPAIFDGIPSAKLEALIEAFDLQETLDHYAGELCPPDRSHYHCALYDALASAVLVENLKNYSEFINKPLLWLLEQSSPEKTRRRGLFRQRNLF
ncbi:MAG: 3'-5' exonuclease [Opitutales bacterium]|nr:3'-5' exonuclease [Opitutales bacterium]MCH8541439.1 3'-5' exonuclease [Opitutales bacterium]